MPLSELLPTVNQLSHQDKLRLIHHLLLQVAKEDGCHIDVADIDSPKRDSLPTNSSESTLLNQLASTEATIWSPQTTPAGIQALSDLLATHKGLPNA
ncbi:MAG: hypothetical protein AAGD25_24375 [Cyanobacteria bacterium P01_F01_bin.150]